MATVFDRLKARAGDFRNRKSVDWYRAQINRLKIKTNASQLIRQGKTKASPTEGNLNLFGYSPKHFNTLKYYDIFPLVLPLKFVPGGFIGLNFHYLPPTLRFKLLDILQRYTNSPRFESNSRFVVYYDDLKNLKIIKPTLKRYLYAKATTPFLKINMDDAAIAAYLPVARFQKATERQVWADSRRML